MIFAGILFTSQSGFYLFISQSGLLENFSDCSKFNWLDKSRPSKKATFVLIM